LPKFVCWQIWLERNRRVFRDESLTMQFIIIKIKILWKESLGEHLSDLNLSQQDLEWGASLDLRFSGDTRQQKDIKEWKFRGKEKDLSDLLLRQSRCSLFFDGAAKGNPGLAGAGGIIKNKEGIIVSKFAWGLGQSTSMQAEALALLQGLKQSKAIGITDISIIGDSQSIITALGPYVTGERHFGQNLIEIHTRSCKKKKKKLEGQF
jgi:ribonuclease HI